MALAQLLYVSRAAGSVCLDDLLHIQLAGIDHNAPRDITGLLLHSGGSFVHFLEGEQDQLDQRFEAISREAWHQDIDLRYRRPTEQRRFGQWPQEMLDLDLHSETERSAFAEIVNSAGQKQRDDQGRLRDITALEQFAELLLFEECDVLSTHS